MARILITDAQQRSSLAAIRSLGRGGHHVIACSDYAKPLAGASRFCRKTYRVPDPGMDSGGFMKAIIGIVEDEAIDVIIPMTDISVPPILELRRSVPALVVPFPDCDAYSDISNKELLMEVASGLGVPTPNQVVLATPPNGKAGGGLGFSAAEVGFPLVVKPSRTAVRSSTGMEKFGVSIVSSEPELGKILARYPPSAYPLLLQERIVGPGLGTFMLFWEGQLVTSFAHRRIREKPPTGGVSVYRESIPLRDDLKEYAERILAHFRWTGVAMVEFKEDAANGTPYLMEVNGRFWGSLQLACDAGIDFPGVLVALALGEEVDVARSYRIGIRSRWLWGDVDHFLWMFRNSAERRSLPPYLPGRLGTLLRLLIPWRPGDRFEVLRFCDPKPFFRESVEWVRSIMK